ncbi:hypothetical protein [Glutamicibacter creatinolyticus]|uniref:hypothetical protein n=1 Tax=Glutamicibacter creatinolyticus TaxID=162496 RepID=UPI003216BAC2
MSTPPVHLLTPEPSRDKAVSLVYVSTPSVAMTWITRFTIALAAVSTLALVAVLVLYFQHIAVPPLVMGVGLYGLPVAFILGAVVIAYSIRQRRRS